MKTLLDILIEKLPDGAEIRNAKETNNRFRFDFVYDGGVSKGNMSKTCAPGREERYVIQEIAAHMAGIALNKGDRIGAEQWLAVAMSGEMPE
ncbi:MAG: hypothetical protein E7449_01055 [Ruminococcaceae bacterium]|nr:hypothetical protein [Oscillospiraceae bacterium]